MLPLLSRRDFFAPAQQRRSGGKNRRGGFSSRGFAARQRAKRAAAPSDAGSRENAA